MGARRSAVDGIQDLIDRTGGPRILAKVKVNQPYAQDQHETMFYRHPRGGKAKYLESPLMSDNPKWIQRFANGLLRTGADAADGWAKVGRGLKDAVPKNAPLEFGDLRRSAGLTVREGARLVVDEPPAQPRLSEQELDAKDYLRHMGEGYRS